MPTFTFPTKRNLKLYGWKPQLPDWRDIFFKPKAVPGIPTSVDLSTLMPLCYDQGQLGSCTGNGIAGALEYDYRIQRLELTTPSRLFIYWNERDIEGTTDQDSGAQIRDGIKVVAHLGAPEESDCPYDISTFTQKPSDQAYADALLHPALKYQAVNQTLDDILNALASGYPIVFGFTVYDSFESPAVASSGVLGMPGMFEQSLGGHCVLCVGYDQTARTFKIRNSWGTTWGQNGYFTMPFDYLTNPQLASDLWILETVK